MRFGRKRPGEASAETRSAAPSAGEGRRVYCIGDIHGRFDLLEQLHARIAADAADGRRQNVLVYLGDYIDRGPQSREVVKCLCEGTLEGFEAVHLLGNHEQTLMDFLQHPREVAGWLTYGGRETLRSYGIDPGPPGGRADLMRLRDELEERLPRHHLEFFESCELMHVEGDYCFAHAGIRPGVPLGEQRTDDLLWIRDEFTESRQEHGCVVVHGHTIAEEVEMLPNRIGIDTGAFYTGVLTCLVLEGTGRRLIQTGVA